jgi:hypothetical protein
LADPNLHDIPGNLPFRVEMWDRETDPKDKKKADELYQQVDELATKLGSEYTALMNELQDMDPDSEDGKEIGSTLEALDKLCSK